MTRTDATDPEPTPPTLHRNATIWTGSYEKHWATDLLVSDGRVSAIDPGPDVLTGEEVVIDHGGAFLMPGLGDVHNHHLLAGRADLFELQLDAAAGLDEVLDAIAAHARGLGQGEWVVGGGWGSTLIDELSTVSTLARLDGAASGHPVMLRDDSCHNRWVSSETLELARIGLDRTADPEDGVVVRENGTGAPVGVLIEAAVIPAERAYAATLVAAQERDLAGCRRAIEILHGFGITGFQDAASSLPMMAALAELDARGELDAWVVTSAQINDKIFGTDPIGIELLDAARGFRTTHHRPDFVKIFLDGVPTSRTALLVDPYLADDAHGAHWVGAATMTQDELTAWLSEIADRGLGAKVHCTGDGAVRMLLDATARLRSLGHRDTVVQLAHGEYIDPMDLPRLAELNVVADLSPPLWFPGVILEAICQCIPRDRAERMCPNRALYDSGVLMAGGSDWPVTPSPNPWIGIQGLVTRADPTGAVAGTLWPEQALTVAEALQIYTVGVARATGTWDITGSLEIGKSADFTVLDRNPFAIESTTLAQTTSTSTWFAGRRVYTAADA